MTSIVESKSPTTRRRFRVGQVWSAVLLYGEERKTGYAFQIVHEDIDSPAPCWLGVKLDIDHDPHNDEHPQCWWFDVNGACTDQFSGFSFRLTRKRYEV